MVSMDVFKADGFSMMSLTTAIQDAETVPGFLGSLGIFTPNPVRTTTVGVEKRGQTLNIIQTSERGAPRNRRDRDRRTLRNFETVRIAESDKMMADEVQNIRGFGSESEFESLQTEVARRQMTLNNDVEATLERHRLSAINGILLDADDSVIYNYFTEFGISQPSEIAFDWANKTDVAGFVNAQVIRPLQRALGQRWNGGARPLVLCGDSFYDKMRANAEYRARYLQTESAGELMESRAFQSVRAWGCEWVNYRGSDDNSTIAIGTTKCKILPLGIPNVFQVAYSPAESWKYVNTLGMPRYSMITPDPSGLDEFVDLHVASYPLHICTTPAALLSGKEGT